MRALAEPEESTSVQLQEPASPENPVFAREDNLLENVGSLYSEPAPEFYMVMRQRVDAWFAERHLSRFAPPAQMAKGIGGLVVAVGCYLLIVTQSVPRWSMLPLCLLAGMSLFICALCLAHDSCHGAISPKGKLNALWSYAYDIAGVSSYVTNIDHMRGHHRAPNVDGIDVAIGSDVELVFRFHPDVPHKPWHRLQHLYFPIAYAFSTLHKWFLLDYTEIARNKFNLRKGRRKGARKVTIALAFKAFTLLWAIILPWYLLRLQWWQLVLGLLAFHLIPGLLVGLTFQLTHLSEGNAFPTLNEHGRLDTSRALHTMMTNLDIMPRARWLNWLSCGLTLHVTHHLFPEVAHAYLPDIAPIVERTAAEYGVPYHKHDSLMAALTAHYRLLKAFGVAPQEG